MRQPELPEIVFSDTNGYQGGFGWPGIEAGTLLSCLLLGLGLCWNVAAESAAIVFVLSMISLLVCAAFYIREVTLALRSVQDEAHDLCD